MSTKQLKKLDAELAKYQRFLDQSFALHPGFLHPGFARVIGVRKDIDTIIVNRELNERTPR